MKKLAGLVIILAVLVFGGYYGMGIVTEKAIKKNIEKINQNKGLTAELGPYQRGLFSSQTNVKWQLHLPARIIKDAEGKPQIIPAQDLKMDIPLTIYHGPMIIADKKLLFGMGYATAVIPIPENYAQQFDTMFTPESTKPVLNTSIFVNYLNKSTIDLNVPAFKLINKDGKSQLDWMNATSTSTLSSGDQLEGKFNVEGISFNKEDAKITLNGANADYNMRKNTNGLYTGNVKFALPTFLVTDKDKKIFAINDLKLSSDSDIDKNLFSTHFSLSIQSILAEGNSYGPGELEISLRNIDAEVLARLNDQAKAMQDSSDSEQKKILFSMLPDLPKLFTKGAELEITEMKLRLPQGLIEGNLLISMPRADLSNPFDLFQKIQGKAQLKLPKEILKTVMHQSIMQQMAKQPEMQAALIQQLQKNTSDSSQPALTQDQIATLQTDKQLASLEQTGLVVGKGTDYSIEVSLEQGKFTVNGKPYDPSLPIKF